MDTSKVKKIISEVIDDLCEDFNFDNSQKVYKPLPGMVMNCKKALQAVQNNDLTSHGGNEGTGKSKANSIISMEPISHSVLKRMKAYFDNNGPAYNQEIAAGKNLSNSGVIQSWNLWGGNDARDFSNRTIGNLNQRNLNRKGLRRDSGMVKTSTLMDPHNTRVKK